MVWVIIIIVFIIIFFIFGYVSNYLLVSSEYETDPGEKTSYHRFVHLSDLHCLLHGRDNERLIRMIDEAKPEFIVISGDLVTKHLRNDSRKVLSALGLLKELAGRYPVYYAPGNHEIRLYDYEGFKEILSETGVIYLDNKKIDLPDNISIYGLELPIEWFRGKKELKSDDVAEYLGEKSLDRSKYNILLAHDPCRFDAYAEWGADLTLSGHLHGGILRLPLLGGVISPYMKLFPKYDAGLYEKNGHIMIVSRGLGTHHIRLRWFNRPEIISISLRKH